eukprot:CAMPEP_0119139450 /NCGR_PEP_ID=MMETSP1310-20130426/27532_1 /TAXON_ID=464262 /ORGANISM="Genus nov. species nov., Strain RCC2339" /LENGTH=255 /DNA_ID=CAMNT_0007130743 /DNA_START=104 /DNA_END=868 /DNA_ORIENTATION=+
MEKGESYASATQREGAGATWIQTDEATKVLLGKLGRELGVQRSYLFQMRGELLYNTHEWTAPRTESFQRELYGLEAKSGLPYFTKELRAGRVVEVTSTASLPEEAEAERKEMQREQISALLLVPVANVELSLASSESLAESLASAESHTLGDQGKAGLPRRRTAGFVGVDLCTGGERRWTEADVRVLRTTGEFLNALHLLCEMATRSPLLPELGSGMEAREQSRLKCVTELYTYLCHLTEFDTIDEVPAPNCGDW